MFEVREYLGAEGNSPYAKRQGTDISAAKVHWRDYKRRKRQEV